MENIFSKNDENLPQKIIGILTQKKMCKIFQEEKNIATKPIYLPTYQLIYIPCFTNLKTELTYLPTYLPTYRSLQTPIWNLPIYLLINMNLVDVYMTTRELDLCNRASICTIVDVGLEDLVIPPYYGSKACTLLWTLLHTHHFVTCLLVILFLCDLQTLQSILSRWEWPKVIL